jgi:GntR family transcriptional regulator, galactonate operon transcriptional repressor
MPKAMSALEANFDRVSLPEKLHHRVTRLLGVRLIEAEHSGGVLLFPNEAQLCHQLGVSRSILREAVKVLADKGMVQVRPRSGTRSRPRSEWNLLDPDILCWQAEARPDARFLREICEVRLGIEPTASGFAALRATPEQIAGMEAALDLREKLDGGNTEVLVESNLRFYETVVAASHNPIFRQLSASIRMPMRVALSFTAHVPASQALDRDANRTLFEAIVRRDPPAAKTAAEEIVGFALLAVEEVIRREHL